MQLHFINVLPCDVKFNYTVGSHNSTEIQLNTTAEQRKSFERNLPAYMTINLDAKIIDPNNLCRNVSVNNWSGDLGTGNGSQGYSVLFTLRNESLEVFRMNAPDHIEKSDNGQPLLGYLLSSIRHFYKKTNE